MELIDCDCMRACVRACACVTAVLSTVGTNDSCVFMDVLLLSQGRKAFFAVTQTLNISRQIKWLNRFVTSVFLFLFLSRLSPTRCSAYALIMFALCSILCVLSNLIDACWERLLNKNNAV